MSSYQISQNHNFQTVLWAVAGFVYRTGCTGHEAVGYIWRKRRVISATIAIPLSLIAAVAFIMLSVATYLVGKAGLWLWDHRAQIGYGAWIGVKVLALTSLCVAGFVLVSMIPLTFWAGVAISAILAYVGYSAASK